MIFVNLLEFAIEDWRTNCRLKNADYGRVLAQSNDGLGSYLKCTESGFLLMIPNPRPRDGHVMLDGCCFASVTLRSKVANFSSTLPRALNIGGAPPALAHSCTLKFYGVRAQGWVTLVKAKSDTYVFVVACGVLSRQYDMRRLAAVKMSIKTRSVGESANLV